MKSRRLKSCESCGGVGLVFIFNYRANMKS
jgi:hypothetical protein